MTPVSRQSRRSDVRSKVELLKVTNTIPKQLVDEATQSTDRGPERVDST